MEDDSAEPQWFREIKREDEREHGMSKQDKSPNMLLFFCGKFSQE